MAKRRLVLTFPPDLVDQPVTFTLVKDFDLMVNVLRARIQPNEEGRLVVELSGKEKSIHTGIGYLKNAGVSIDPLAREIKWHETSCTHCSACIPQCPTNALSINRSSMMIAFNKTRCIACELCIPACPFSALEILF